MFEQKSIVDAGNFFVLPGAYFGILIDSYYLGGSSKYVNRTVLWKGLLRLGILIIGALILLSP